MRPIAYTLDSRLEYEKWNANNEVVRQSVSVHPLSLKRRTQSAAYSRPFGNTTLVRPENWDLPYTFYKFPYHRYMIHCLYIFLQSLYWFRAMIYEGNYLLDWIVERRFLGVFALALFQ